MKRPAALFLALALPGIAAAAPTTPPPSATAPSAAPSKPWALNWRYRHEAVSDDAFRRDANAHTLRLRASWTERFAPGWSAQIEAEGVAELNDRFNSGANGRTMHPAVPDARALEINQAWLDWSGAGAGARIGRQMLVLDNARFFGNGAWRQNMQTFDAVQARWKPAPELELQTFYLDRVHRSAGDRARDRLARERRLNAPLARIAYSLPNGSLVAYGYWVEDEDVPRASTRSLGLRWATAWALSADWKAGLVLERAQQTPWADAVGGSTAYALVEPRLEHGPLVVRAGWERLGAGRGRAFQTPLATLHAFNGWADKFLTTPIGGLRDTWLGVQNNLTLFGKPAQWQLKAHNFTSDAGVDYGHEWNASLNWNFHPGWSALLKVADYRSDGFARDTRKLWFQIEWAL